MKVTLNWLKQYVEFAWSADELAARLTLLGLEVEQVQRIGGVFDGIVVAQVITRDKHPNADKLSLCRVNDGTGERQIVCGAQNFQAGDKVPLILPGASLPLKPGETAPFTIKVGKIRGVESHGMLCSPEELGLEPEAYGLKREVGLLILKPDAQVGQPFAECLGLGGSDVVYDLEVTPNRPDLNSVIGIAREIAAITGNPLRVPDVGQESRLSSSSNPESETGATPVLRCADLVAVRIEDAGFCPRYTARVVQGVKVGPSPDWLRSTLEKVGIRSISNVVDVTNYVMLETGQPLHAFDYHLIAKSADGKPTIVVRRAEPGERFVTLDGQARTLIGDMLLIADERKGIALAGVMGGANTEINDQTVDVLIESAYFAPASIRRTSKQLGLRSESSYRFERGADPGITEWASRRCAQIILETAGGTLADGVVDAYPSPAAPRQITLRPHKVNELLGLTLTPEEIESPLLQLGLRPPSRKPRPVDAPPSAEPMTFQVPSWRVDLKRETDLIEEVERLRGVERTPATPPRGAIGAHPFDALHDQIAEARHILCGLGLFEAQGQTLVSDAAARLWTEASPALLANPLSSDMNTLRPSLLPGLLDSLRHNLARQNHDVGLFEVGRVFRAGAAGEPPFAEERRVAIALTGRRQAPFWSGDERDTRFDPADLKGFIEEFLEQFGVRGGQFARQPDNAGPFLESAAISLGGRVALGRMGQLQPALARQHDLRDAVLLAELNLDQLLARRNAAKSFKPLPAFPSVRRDVAMFVPEAVSHDAVLAVVRQAKPANLEAVDLFDVFRGRHVPAGQKSLAYAFTYRNAGRTLTDTEVNAAQEKLVADLKQKLSAVVRDA